MSRAWTCAGVWMLGLVLSAGASAQEPPPAPPLAWRALFNGQNLDGWATFMQEAEPGQDPTGVVTVVDGMIHGYRTQPHGAAVPMGYIGTRESFSDYHLKLEYRWGRKQFAPRFLYKPDAGVYYHHATADVVWPQALQFQVELHDTGDLLTVGAIRLETTIDPANRREDWQQFLPASEGGVPITTGGLGVSYTRRQAHHEREGWNRIDLVCRGDEAAHLVNGQLVNRARGIAMQDPADPAQWKPLTAGRILLEFEATEVFYRGIEIRALDPSETLDAAIDRARADNLMK